MPSLTVNRRLNRYQRYFDRATAEYDLPEGLLRAMAAAESSGDPHAVGASGEAGLMQFMPTTGREYGLSGADRFDPAASIDAAGRLTRDLLNAFKEDTHDAIRAYNAGPTGVRARGAAYRQSTGHLRRVLVAWGKGAAIPTTSGNKEERQAALDAARQRRDEGAEAVEADARANQGAAPGGMWNPANWRYYIGTAQTEATASVVLLVVGVIALYIGVKNA